MGVGIVAQMAYEPKRDAAFACLPASHLFEKSTTRLALRKQAFLRSYVYAFITLFAPRYDRKAVDALLDDSAKA
jgi:LysR family cys regulon transcriptional activator